MKRFNMNKFIGPVKMAIFLSINLNFYIGFHNVIIIHYLFDKRENESWNVKNYAKLPSFS